MRRAVHAALSDLGRGDLVLVGLSGGPDSLAVAAALAAEAAPRQLRAGAVVVDHGLQPRSAEVCRQAADRAEGLGLNPVEVVSVSVDRSVGDGPEAAARRARLAALQQAADRWGAATILLGHTLDDQAETVLLGLARGSGARSLAGMSPRRGVFRRPLLQVRRSVTEAACAELSLQPWQDPHNCDRSMARARVRHEALPALAEALGDGVSAALARTADRLREDDEALTLWAQRLHDEASTGEGGLEVAVLAAAPAGARVRALRLAALASGVPGGSLRTLHLKSLDDLVIRWRGQGAVSLPGGVRGLRRCGRLYLARVDEV